MPESYSGLLSLGSLIRKKLKNYIKENETTKEDKVQIEQTEKNYIKELYFRVKESFAFY